jgi:hypothetical protein
MHQHTTSGISSRGKLASPDCSLKLVILLVYCVSLPRPGVCCASYLAIPESVGETQMGSGRLLYYRPWAMDDLLTRMLLYIV